MAIGTGSVLCVQQNIARHHCIDIYKDLMIVIYSANMSYKDIFFNLTTLSNCKGFFNLFYVYLYKSSKCEKALCSLLCFPILFASQFTIQVSLCQFLILIAWRNYKDIVTEKTTSVFISKVV